MLLGACRPRYLSPSASTARVNLVEQGIFIDTQVGRKAIARERLLNDRAARLRHYTYLLGEMSNYEGGIKSASRLVSPTCCSTGENGASGGERGRWAGPRET